MIQEIDFQDYDVNERDGEEAAVKRVHRAGMKLDIAERALVYLKTGVEDFAEPDDEPSLIETLAENFGENGNQFQLMRDSVSLRLAISPDNNEEIDKFCFALLQDLLDIGIDRVGRYDHITVGGKIMRIPRLLTQRERFPRLAVVAVADPENFAKFQSAVNKNQFGNLDLADFEDPS